MLLLQVNSEFYTGWLDHWGDQHAVVDTQKVSRVLAEMLSMGANVNMYVPLTLVPEMFLPLGTRLVKGTVHQNTNKIFSHFTPGVILQFR